LVEAHTYRVQAHTNAMTRAATARTTRSLRGSKRDPLKRLDAYLTERGLLGDEKKDEPPGG